MTLDQVQKSIPIYDEIHKTEKNIREIESFINNEINRLIIYLNSPQILEVFNLNSVISSNILSTILEYKKQHVLFLKQKLEKI